MIAVAAVSAVRYGKIAGPLLIAAAVAAGASRAHSVAANSSLIGFEFRGDLGPASIRTVDEDGRIVRTLVRNAEHFAWRPDGRQIAFVRNTRTCLGGGFEDQCAALYVANADGTGIRRVTPLGLPGFGMDFAWSPDGRWIAYMQHIRRPTRIWAKIFLVKSSGGGRHRLTKGGDLHESSPEWSPNGRLIAFTASRGEGNHSIGPSDIYVVRSDGTRLRRLTDNPTNPDARTIADDCCARWSPDGRWLAYLPRRTNSYELGLMTPNGSGKRRLTTRMEVGSFAWSADATRIAFDSGCTRCPYFGSIFVLPVVGGVPRRLAAQGSRASWSPDGRRLAYQTTTQSGSDSAVWTMHSDGSGKRWLADGEGPAWQPAQG